MDPSSHRLARLACDRRGVSEAISALLMMLIAIAAGTMLYSYSARSFGIAYSQFNNHISTDEQIAEERFSVLYVWSSQSNNQVNATVMNYGEVDLVIAAAYVNRTQVTQFQGGMGVSVGLAQIVNLKFTSPITITRGLTYILIVATRRGTTFATSWKA